MYSQQHRLHDEMEISKPAVSSDPPGMACFVRKLNTVVKLNLSLGKVCPRNRSQRLGAHDPQTVRLGSYT
jgi:hypothetical protein